MLDLRTKMRAEIQEIPDAIQRLLDNAEQSVRLIGDHLRDTNPHTICTIARGSSDHAAYFLKYAIELTARVPVASIGPSVNSIYGVDLNLANCASLAISQSGKSPDIVSMVRSATRSGSYTFALTNNSGSPLAEASQQAIDIQAGVEASVAATKTFVNSIVAGLLVLARWQKDTELSGALYDLPALAEKAVSCEWPELLERLSQVESVFVLGRGPSFGIANEVALKFKETCQIHAEAFSSAEVLHGPVSVVRDRFPVLALISNDASEQSMTEVAEKVAKLGGDVFATRSLTSSSTHLPVVSSRHSLCDALLQVVTFYAQVEKLSRIRGLNPDEPQNLKKVTETL